MYLNKTYIIASLGSFCLICFLFRMAWNKEMLYCRCSSILP